MNGKNPSAYTVQNISSPLKRGYHSGADNHRSTHENTSVHIIEHCHRHVSVFYWFPDYKT